MDLAVAPRLASTWGEPALFLSLIASLAISLAACLFSVPIWVIAFVFVLSVFVITTGVAVPTSGVFARPIVAAETTRPEIALTFDDGPDPIHTPPILDLLESRGHRATFFVIGNRAARQPALLADMARRGHELANHSYAHAYTTPFLSPARLARELVQTNAILEAASGQRPRWFRPPVGLLSPRVAAAAKLAQLSLVAWTATARDGTARTNATNAVERLSRKLTPGAILVLHDAAIRGDRTPIARATLSDLLDRLDEKKLRSVTLSELLADSPGS